MDGGSLHCVGDKNEDHPHRNKMQTSKMAIGGGLANNCGKQRSKEQRRKEKIYVYESRDPKE